MPRTEASDPHRLKRLTLRSWRRGIREMDLILGPYADARLAALDAARLDAYEALLEENDQDLYQWVTAQAAPAAAHELMIGELRIFHRIT